MRERLQKNGAFAPDFIVIGAMKAGTTTLNRYLNQHSDISMARIKETDFFLNDAAESLDRTWYKAQFDLTRDCLGETSPNYTKYDIFPGVPERIHAVAPDVKLIFVARDPVSRFASHYRHSWLQGHMSVAPQDLLGSPNGSHMIECSRYATQLEKYLRYFDRAQILIIDFDTLCTDPQLILNEIAEFLGLCSVRITEITAANTADQVARIPRFVKRAARSRFGRRIDRFMSGGTKQALSRVVSRRHPMAVPTLEYDVLQRATELLHEDAVQFRTMTGRDFVQWSV